MHFSSHTNDQQKIIKYLRRKSNINDENQDKNLDTNEVENEDEGVDKFVVGQCGSSDISGGSSRVIIHPQPATSQGPVTHI